LKWTPFARRWQGRCKSTIRTDEHPQHPVASGISAVGSDGKNDNSGIEMTLLNINADSRWDSFQELEDPTFFINGERYDGTRGLDARLAALASHSCAPWVF
jgi:hypothetical protein